MKQQAPEGHYVPASLAATTSPHFVLVTGSWLGDVTPSGTPSTVTFSDLDADLSAAGNRYFYGVTPVNASGAFVFDLAPGSLP